MEKEASGGRKEKKKRRRVAGNESMEGKKEEGETKGGCT